MEGQKQENHLKLPQIPTAQGGDDSPGLVEPHGVLSSKSSYTSLKLPHIHNSRSQQFSAAFRKNVERVIIKQLKSHDLKSDSDNDDELTPAQQKAKEAALRHQRYHNAVRRGRDPRTFARNAGPLWSTISQLNDRKKKASSGAPLRVVLELEDLDYKQAPINDSLNQKMQPVKHAAAAIQYMGQSAYQDTDSQERHLKGNIEAILFGEPAHADSANSKNAEAKQEKLVPNFNPDTDLASVTSNATLFFGSFVMISKANDDRQYLTADYDNQSFTVSRLNAPKGQRIFQVVNLLNLNDSSPVQAQQKIWLKVFEQKRRMKIKHNTAEIVYLERRGAVIGTTMRHYTLPKELQRSSRVEADGKNMNARRSVPAFVPADFSVVHNAGSENGGNKNGVATRTLQSRQRYNANARAIGKWRLIRPFGKTTKQHKSGNDIVRNGDVVYLEQDNLSLASGEKTPFCQVLQTDSLQIDSPALLDSSQWKSANSVTEGRVLWRIHLVQPHESAPGEAGSGLHQGDKAARLLSKARHQMNQSEKYRKGSVRHENGVYSGATFTRSLREKLKRIGMASEDKFISAHHKNVGFLNRHFMPPDMNRDAVVLSRFPFAARVKSMKERLQSRDMALHSSSSSLQLPDNNIRFSDVNGDKMLGMLSTDMREPGLDFLIPHAYTRNRCVLPLIDDTITQQFAAEDAAAEALERQRAEAETKEAESKSQASSIRSRSTSPVPKPASSSAAGQHMLYSAPDVKIKPAKHRRKRSQGDSTWSDKRSGRPRPPPKAIDPVLENLRVAETYMSDHGRAQLVSRGRTATPVRRKTVKTPACSDNGDPRTKVELVDNSTASQYEYALHLLQGIDAEVSNIDLNSEDKEEQLPIYEVEPGVAHIAAKFFDVPPHKAGSTHFYP